jgi:hypothetical protein
LVGAVIGSKQAGGDLRRIEKQRAADRQRHLRRGPLAARDPDIRVEAEGDRHRGVLGRLERYADLDRSRSKPGPLVELVEERDAHGRSALHVALQAVNRLDGRPDLD